MTALQRVRRARRTLVATAGIAALLWGAAAALAVLATALLVELATPLPPQAHAALWPIAALAALVTIAAMAWRWRMARSVERVALWIEERQPELRFALVTAMDPVAAPEQRYPDLHARARSADVGGLVGRAQRRALAHALLATLPLAALVTLLEPAELLDAARSELTQRVSVPPPPLANRLEGMTAEVTPPAYSRLPPESVADPSGVSALIGSRVVLGGDGPPEGVGAVLDGDSLAAADRDGGARRRDGWQISLSMPESPAVVSLHDREYRRLVVLEPRTDSIPELLLRRPVNDTTYQSVPSGQLVTEALARDDIGLNYGYIEYMVTAGSGEIFDTRVTRSPNLALGNARSATIRDMIRLDTMGLAPGAVLHIRAIALDHNDVTGPGRGVSETRTLRVAEPMDSVSLTPAPPLPIDSMWMSQRLLNMRTDTLIRTGDTMDRRTFMGTSSGYSNAQEEIRSRASAVIAILEEDGVGGTFETQVSRMLRRAVDLMYEARVHLAIARPDSAMPYMIEVLEILDEIRLANRYYLRGIMPPQTVNIERVRLSGEDPAGDERREARRRLDDPAAALAVRLERAVALVRTSPESAMDSLTHLRVSALGVAPEAAAALAELMGLLQPPAGADRTERIEEAIARARRALEPRTVRIRGPLEWGGIP